MEQSKKDELMPSEMEEFKTSPIGMLINIQLNKPTKKYNRKVGTFHIGLRVFERHEAQRLIDELHQEQHEYAQINKITNENYLSLPFFDGNKVGMGDFIDFNPFRLNSCGWSAKANNVYVNIPKVFDETGKQISNERFTEYDKAYLGRVFYGVEGYNNQEGVGVVLRLRGAQILEQAPRQELAS